ncbi:nitronate monooxygenase [Halopolyspora algeriensis]|uniref:Nitronate monooxygenase n=1 Tax=Halopolyspora algeriensis TaxID=1500506 RepID=A0A368VRH0_9ACTN|nr:nitronate monooxygenase family protein [Halopolyspora algeriensis]RCW44510.1 nitronate monooxygenase [Halopolyspora algeriensis]TQM55870.1 nitronate monooxygenase [Halopolyspora algeriensis]
MSIATRATELLGVEHPIVLAPMGDVSGGELAAAVSRAGGLGLIGGGYGDANWLTREFDAAAGARVGCGFITWSLARQPDLLDVALERDPVAVMLSFGDPAPFAERVRASGAVLLCQVQNRGQAERALDVGADVLVAQGTEAGGHGYGSRTTLTLVPELADLVDRRGSEAVVLAAGGIADGRGLAAALTLGASGALVGTRFYLAAEALSTPQARDHAVGATGEDTCRTTVYDIVRGYPWPEGHTVNTLGNDFVSRWHGAESELQRDLGNAAAEYRRAVAERDYDIANVFVGQAAGLVDSVLPAADIVTDIADRAEVILGGLVR